MDERNDMTSHEAAAAAQPASQPAPQPTPQPTPQPASQPTSQQASQPAQETSFEEELRAAYEQLEAARRKLEELKAKNPPVSGASDMPGSDPSRADSADPAYYAVPSPDQAPPAGPAPAEPNWVPYTPPTRPEAYRPPSYGQAPQSASVPSGSVEAQGGAQAQQPQAQQPQSQPQPQQSQSTVPGSQPQQPYYGGGYAPSGQQGAPQQPYQAYQQPYYPAASYVQTKDHVAAGLLGIFLGWLGIHKFYLGYNTVGFVMLAVTVLGSLFTFGLAASVMALIGVIEGIIYLAKSQTEFEQLYVFSKREWF